VPAESASWVQEWWLLVIAAVFAGNEGITDKGAARLIQALATNLSVTDINLAGCE